MAWESLLSIIEQNRQFQLEEPEIQRQACPNDGEPLQFDSDGRLHCRFDGYTADA